MKLVVSQGGEVIETINGDHFSGMTNHDVKVLHIEDQLFNYFPLDIENFFPGLEGMKIVSSGLKSLSHDNLKWFPDLQFCDFTDNEIESLDADLFASNANLKFVTLDSNKINSVGKDIFEPLNEVETISIKSNQCVDGLWTGSVEIAEAKALIAEKCWKEEESLENEYDDLSTTESMPEHVDKKKKEKIVESTQQPETVSDCEFSETYWKFSESELFTCTIANTAINQGYELNVSPSEGEKVHGFSLNDNQFVKYLPENIEKAFPNLVEYSAINTYLESISAANFEGLSKLKKLNLSDNDLSVIESGTFAELTELEQLDLSEGNIRLIEEGAFAGLSSLKSLNLGGNKLRSLNPKTFEGLTELRNLSLELNHLNDIDDSLFSTNTKLVNIWLNGNKINVLNPKAFEGLSKLIFIDLQDNECIDEDYEPSNLDEMNKILDESCSDIETSTEIVIERTVRKKFKVKSGEDVTLVDVRDEYHEVDHDATLFTFVQDVEVSGMEETAETTTSGELKVTEVTSTTSKPEDKTVSCVVGDVQWRFSESNLKTCVIADQTIDAKEFKIAEQTNGGDVKGLIMSNSKLMKYLPENTAETFPNLQEFAAQNSSLVLLSKKNFEGLRHLKTLNLANNNIKFIESDTFDDLKDLEELDLSGNSLENIDEEIFAKLKSLKVLRLGENKLHFVHPKLFRNLRSLQNVSISSNQISMLDGSLFKTNQKLNNVWLQNNKIKSLSPNIFDKTKTLEYVDLRDNKCIDGVFATTVFDVMKKEILEKCGDKYALKQGAKIKKPKEKKKKEKTTKKPDSDEDDNLKDVGCEYEDLYWPNLNETLFTCIVTADQVIDETGFRMAANVAPYNLPLINGDVVQALKFAPNKNIKFLPEKISKDFPNLIAFSAVDTSVETISKKHFKKLAKLKSVDLSSNTIRTFDVSTFEDLDSLEELILYDNDFEIIEQSTFINNKKTKRLNLAGNKLKEVSPGAFEIMKELVELSIDLEDSSNDEKFVEDIFEASKNLEVLTLNGHSYGRDLKLIDPRTVTTVRTTTLADSTTEKKVVQEDHQEVSCHFDNSDLFTCELKDDVEIISDMSYIIKPSDDDDKVERFVISKNSKFKNLPANLAQVFPNLIEISASDSGLVGVEKANFDGLKSLKLLNLSSNAIKHLESETFDSLANVENLDLSGNEMEFIEETLLYKLRNLKNLKLSSNKLHFVHSKTLKHLENLETFSIDGNLLSVLEPSTFRHNKKLQAIDLSENKIESLSPKLFKLKNLHSVNLEGNNCIDQAFNQLTVDNLEETIKENCKPRKEKKTFECEVSLDDNSCTVSDQPIDDSDYLITMLPPSVISGDKIERLVFNGNDIKFLPSFISKHFPNLIEISALGTSLESVTKETFANLQKLKSLRLKVADLPDPDAFKDLTSLETLIIETDAEDIDENIFSDLESLEIIYLTSKKLRKVPRKLLNNLSELSEIELSFDPSMFDTIEIEASLVELPKLRKLNINGNLIVMKEIEKKPKEEEVAESTSTFTIVNLHEEQNKEVDEATKPPPPSMKPKPSARTKPTRAQRPSTTTERSHGNKVTCSLSYHEWAKPNVTLITCSLNNQKIEEAETSIQQTPYSNHVQGLQVEDNKSVKYLPDNILEASPNLVRLSAKNSSIEAIFVEDLEGLKELKNLDLSYNKIESIEPFTFVDLVNLEELNLSNNGIDYVDENAFANLTNLKSIDLSNNKINFLHPKTFINLLELQSLDLEGNNLPRGFEDELRKYNPNLINIIISFNQEVITSTTTEKFIFHGATEIPCSFIDAYWFFTDSNLFSCDLKGEIFDSTSTIEQSTRNRRVKGLNFLDNKRIKFLPQNLGEALPNLIGISGFNSSLQSISASDFVNLKKLKYLNLAKNNLREIPSNTFDHLTSLEELDLSDNEIESLDESTFEKLTSLQTLYLGGNRLEHLPTRIFEFLPNLRNISLENNRIALIDGNIFRNNPKLENVWLNGNKIKVLSHTMFEVQRFLEYVDLQHNDCINQFFEGNMIEQLRLDILKNCQVKEIQTEPVTFRPDTKPSILKKPQEEVQPSYEYEDNGPSRIDPNEEIEILNVAGNKVFCEFGETFSSYVNSDLYTCKITSQSIDNSDFSIKDVPQNNRVKRTVIESKNVNYLPQNIGESFPHLLELEVRNSSLKSVKPENFLNLRKLKLLDLSGNDLHFIEPQTFDELSSLEVLTLSDNKIKCFDELRLSSLTILNLDGNSLSFFDPKAFSKLWELIEINLANNNLNEISGDLFRFNTKLEIINLSDNKIQSIDATTFESFPNIKIINLSSNICIDKVFDADSLQTLKPTIQQTCQTYDELKNLLLGCKREVCPTLQVARPDNRRDRNLRKENENLRALLVKTSEKVDRISNHNKKLRNSLSNDRSLARKLKVKVKSLETENEILQSSSKACTSLDQANNFLINIDCEYEETADDVYSCNTKNLHVESENSTIDVVSENHLVDKRNTDVVSLKIKNQSTKFLPSGISDSFPNLNKIVIENSNLRKLAPGGFKGLNSLGSLIIRGNKIAFIEPKSFDDNINLQLLNLSGNNIEQIPPKIFDKLVNLLIVILSDNKIKSLPFDIFPQRNSLDQFLINKNQLETVDTRIFQSLIKALSIDFSDNTCVDGKYLEADGDDQQTKLSLFGEIAMKCSENKEEFCKV